MMILLFEVFVFVLKIYFVVVYLIVLFELCFLVDVKVLNCVVVVGFN